MRVQVPGEGLYACYNKGSCVAPDTCECADGWEGFDCSTRTYRALLAVTNVSPCTYRSLVSPLECQLPSCGLP